MNNRTAIYEAIENNHDDCTDILINADIECYDSEYIADFEDETLCRGLYPIHVAIQKHNLACVKKLVVYTGGNEIRYDNRIHTKDNSGITSLMLAAKHGSENCLKYLFDEGADIYAECAEALTAVMYAAKEGRTKCVELLLQEGSDVNDTSEYGMTAMMYAAKGGHAACLNVLLQSGAGLTSYECAIQGNSAECVKLLMEAGADVNSDSRVLHLVVNSNTPESFKMLEMFMNAGVDVSNTPVPLLPRAAGIDALEHMQLLLNSGADVNAVDNLGQSALIISCALERTSPSECTEEAKTSWYKRKYKCIELLLNQGADVNMKDNSQYSTALIHLAQRGKSQDFAELLIKAGADVNSRRSHGATAYSRRS